VIRGGQFDGSLRGVSSRLRHLSNYSRPVTSAVVGSLPTQSAPHRLFAL
jgi:hypothetical protein